MNDPGAVLNDAIGLAKETGLWKEVSLKEKKDLVRFLISITGSPAKEGVSYGEESSACCL